MKGEKRRLENLPVPPGDNRQRGHVPKNATVDTGIY